MKPLTWAGLVLPLLLSACGDPPPTERYGFLALLGRDTLSVEAVTRYPNRFVSEEVDRFPEVKRRHTEVELAPDGSPRHLDMRVRIPSADSNARERRIVADFAKDQVRVSLTDGSGTHGVTMANDGKLSLPHVPQMYSLIELYFSSALKRAAAESLPAGGTIETRQFYPDRELANYPRPMHKGYVRPGQNGHAEIEHYWLAGTGTAELDSAGRMQSYSGARTTYRVTVTRLADPPDVEAIGNGFAAAESARGRPTALSVRDTLRAQIGAATFTVDYGRPLARGRTLLGDVIPYDRVWRTGANAATQFSTSAPIRLGSIALAPGTYTLWTLPARSGVALIINRQIGQWGTGYGPAYDIGRTPMISSEAAAPVEEFTIAIEPKDERSGILAMAWGPFRWTAPITVTKE
jgi:hypothetical protein